MSKKSDFKHLLDENAGTGADQKIRILGSLLIPDGPSGGIVTPTPSGIQGAETDKAASTLKQDGENTPSGSTEEKLDNSAQNELSTGPNSHDSALGQSEENHINSHPKSESSSMESHVTSAPGEEGISTLVSNLKNLEELNVEDTHTRKTYLIDNQLLAELDKVSEGKKKGYKTKMINTGLRIVLELMRNDSSFKV